MSNVAQDQAAELNRDKNSIESDVESALAFRGKFFDAAEGEKEQERREGWTEPAGRKRCYIQL